MAAAADDAARTVARVSRVFNDTTKCQTMRLKVGLAHRQRERGASLPEHNWDLDELLCNYRHEALTCSLTLDHPEICLCFSPFRGW